jgi:hypothetical protein
MPDSAIVCQQSLAASVTILEFFDTASSGVNCLLTGVERVRMAGNFHFNQWIFFTVFPCHVFFGVDGGAGQEREAASHVLKDDFSVIRVNAGLHVEILKLFGMCEKAGIVHLID